MFQKIKYESEKELAKKETKTMELLGEALEQKIIKK